MACFPMLLVITAEFDSWMSTKVTSTEQGFFRFLRCKPWKPRKWLCVFITWTIPMIMILTDKFNAWIQIHLCLFMATLRVASVEFFTFDLTMLPNTISMGESVGTSLNPPQKFRFIMWVMLAGNVLEAPELESLGFSFLVNDGIFADSFWMEGWTCEAFSNSPWIRFLDIPTTIPLRIPKQGHAFGCGTLHSKLKKHWGSEQRCGSGSLRCTLFCSRSLELLTSWPFILCPGALRLAVKSALVCKPKTFPKLYVRNLYPQWVFIPSPIASYLDLWHTCIHLSMKPPIQFSVHYLYLFFV